MTAVWIAISIVAGIFVLIFIAFLLQFLGLWIQATVSNASVSLFDMIGMRFRKVDLRTIVINRIRAVKAGMDIPTNAIETHYLAGGRVNHVITAMISAQKAKIELPWNTATAIDLAGRDILDAVQTSVNPKVIDCPAQNGPRATIDAVAKNGRWSTLMVAGRASQVWDEIPETTARTQDEWIAQHIRAMAAIRLGKLGEARQLLQNGLDRCPFPNSREYFRMAFAVLQLRQRNYASVKGTLEQVQSAVLAVPRALLLAHAAGEQGETQTTREHLDGISGPITALSRSVATELRVRYVDHLAPMHDDDWLLSRELELLGSAA